MQDLLLTILLTPLRVMKAQSKRNEGVGGDREINVLHHMTRSVEGPGTEEDHELGAREITALNSFLINSLSQGQRNRDVA